MIDHLQGLGVTAVEFLPVHAFVQDRHLIEKGLTNYWGYNTIGFFAPEPRYLAAGDLAEWKAMVALPARCRHRGDDRRRLQPHRRGQPPRPDAVVQGHRQRLLLQAAPEDPRFYWDCTGCGNTLNLSATRACCRWSWIACATGSRRCTSTASASTSTSALARDPYDFDYGSGFLDAVRQDPVLSRVKLIAEPWDLGDGGYQVGGFPPGWSEWNGKFRDTVRRYWKGEPADARSWRRA